MRFPRFLRFPRNSREALVRLSLDEISVGDLSRRSQSASQSAISRLLFPRFSARDSPLDARDSPLDAHDSPVDAHNSLFSSLCRRRSRPRQRVSRILRRILRRMHR